ncbi:MAG TPA: SRPBCC family protein [Candidatus Binataceae bacterium]|nr:SRPBCC family protein [Candidatus Binataceae bacterium]
MTTTVSYSTVFDQTADRVWSIIRDFNSYPVWVASVSDSYIEDGKPGDAVGAIRNFTEYGIRIRQRLLAHSDPARSYTYESCEPLAAMTYYQGTARVTPIVDGNRALVEWSVAFECPAEARDNCRKVLEEAMPQWLKSLRAVLE